MSLTLTRQTSIRQDEKTVEVSVQKTADNDCMRIILETQFNAQRTSSN